MASFIAIAQGFKIATGLAQAAFALWVMIRAPMTRVNSAFALAFGANGVAYAIFNLAQPGLRTPHSFALELFALIFATESSVQVRSQCALFSAALAINSVDHIGAAVIRSDWQFPGNVVVELVVMLVILGLWLWNSRAPGWENSGMALIVILCMIIPFLAGVLVRIALRSYRAVQESGFIGAGRIAATALLIYGMLARGLFSPQGERDGAAASVGGN